MPVKLRPSPPPLAETGKVVLILANKNKMLGILQNQVQIDFDNENDDFCDENSNTFNDYVDENDQKNY